MLSGKPEIRKEIRRVIGRNESANESNPYVLVNAQEEDQGQRNARIIGVIL